MNAVAWHDRFGTKTQCSWCSGVCVERHNADETCVDGGTLEAYLTGTPLPKPTPEPVEPVAPTNPEPVEPVAPKIIEPAPKVEAQDPS